jgi:Amt family ammonium transporter
MACIFLRASPDAAAKYTPILFLREEWVMDFTMIVDTIWVLLAAVLVFFMNLGFAAVESGFARSKNAVNILSKNFIVFAVSSLGFMLLGWGLMFGGDNPIVGTQQLFILGNSNLDFYKDTLTSNVPFWGKFFFQLVFCGTAATIVSGAVAERVKYLSFILFSFILTLVIYPIVGHWIWGGGWLASLGLRDIAGDTVVHSLGGWAALAGALILGPRHGKYGKDGKPKAIPGHNMSLAVIGLFVLWLGWFGFNPGSTMSFQNPADVVHILVTTNTAPFPLLLPQPLLGSSHKPALAANKRLSFRPCRHNRHLRAFVSLSSSSHLRIGLRACRVFCSSSLTGKAMPVAVHLCFWFAVIFGTFCVGLFATGSVSCFLLNASILVFPFVVLLLSFASLWFLFLGLFCFFFVFAIAAIPPPPPPPGGRGVGDL